jgi:4-amino-4-deoxy-L-arabinose transferase-like glycosyltransferase
VYKDYGVPIDEPVERNSGVISLNAIGERFRISWILNDASLQNEAKKLGSLQQYRDRDYPVLYSVISVALEKAFRAKSDQDIYFFRHLLNYLTCLVGVYAIYRMAKRRFSSWQLGILAAAFFILTPRMFAESFYNSKDLIFLSAFAVATYSLISFIEKPTVKLALWHALATGIAINVRNMAVIIIVMSIFVILLRAFRKELSWRQIRLPLFVFLVVTPLAVIALWPWLWTHPIEHFTQAFSSMSKFMRGPSHIMYLGDAVEVTKLPWHYAFVWIGVTTPIFYLGLFVLGFGLIVWGLLVNRIRLYSSFDQLQDLIFLALFFGPLLAVIVLNSVLYNGWRQLFFIYPAFLLVALRAWVWVYDSSFLIGLKGFHGSWKVKFWKWIFVGSTFFCLIQQAVWMKRAHPFQFVYFNELSGKEVLKRFEGDYWAIANRQALDWILQQDTRSLVAVNGAWIAVQPSVFAQPEHARLLLTTSQNNADYLVNAYNPEFEEVHRILVNKQPISIIYKRKPPLINLTPVQLNSKIEFGTNAIVIGEDGKYKYVKDTSKFGEVIKRINEDKIEYRNIDKYTKEIDMDLAKLLFSYPKDINKKVSLNYNLIKDSYYLKENKKYVSVPKDKIDSTKEDLLALWEANKDKVKKKFVKKT